MDQEHTPECPFTDIRQSQQSAKTSTKQEAVLEEMFRFSAAKPEQNTREGKKYSTLLHAPEQREVRFDHTPLLRPCGKHSADVASNLRSGRAQTGLHEVPKAFNKSVRIFLDKNTKVPLCHDENKLRDGRRLTSAYVSAAQSTNTSKGSVSLPYAFKPPESSIIYHSSSRRKNRTLIQAAREGSREQVDRLLEDGANIAQKDCRGWTALHEAAKAGNQEIVECLLTNGASVNAKDNRGCTALHRAASWGHSSVATMLITHGCNINEKDDLGQSALHKALRWRHSSTATCLLEHGANSKERDNAGRLPQEMRFRRRAKRKTRPLLGNVALESEVKPYQKQSLQRDKIPVQFGGGLNPTVLCSKLPASPVISVLAVPESSRSSCSSVCSSNSSGYASLEEDPMYMYYLLSKNIKREVLDRNTEDEFVHIKGQLQPLETIAESHVTLKEDTKYYQRPLHRAAIDGDLEKVRSCFAHNFDVNDKDIWNKTPLHYAAQCDHISVLHFLIMFGANIEALDNQQQTPLHKAASGGSARAVQCLLEHGANPQAVDEYGLTAADLVDESLPLIKRKILVQQLARKETEKRDKKVEKKEDENDQRKQIRSELQFDKNIQQQEAHATKEKITLAKGSTLRLDKTSKPELQNKPKDVPNQLKDKFEPEREKKMQEFTKLQPIRSQSSKPQSIKVTPRKGHKESRQSKDVFRSTALQRATCSGDIELVETLLYGGWDIGSTDEDECTSLHRAAIRGFTKIIQLLLNHGSDITAKDSDGWTPLHGASAAGHLDSVRCLTQRGADNEAKDYTGCIPLHRAAMRGQTSVARFLLQQGCASDVSDKDGWTPLHGAARYGHTDMVKLLIQHGANARAVDNLGQTSLDLARAAGHFDCCTTLEKQKTTCPLENKENPLHLNSCLKMEHDENNDSRPLKKVEQTDKRNEKRKEMREELLLDKIKHQGKANTTKERRTDPLKQLLWDSWETSKTEPEPTKRCEEQQLKENRELEFESHDLNYNRQIGQARECIVDKSGGTLSIADIKLVVSPDSISNKTKIRVKLEDPADFYSSFDDARLMSSVVIAQPVARLEPSGACFNVPVTFSTVLHHEIGRGEELLVLHGSYYDANPGKCTWEDMTDTACFDAESGTLTVKLAHFSLLMILYKLVVIQPKVIISWLNLKSFWYHMMLFCKKNTPFAPYTDVRVVFLSEDIYQFPGLREHEDAIIEKLRNDDFKEIFNYHDDETYTRNGEELNVTLDLDPGFKMSPAESSNTKKLDVESNKWWTNGEQLSFIVSGDNISETISGRIRLEKSNRCLSIPFKADDLHGYLQNYVRRNKVSNLLPIADILGLDEEQKTWVIQSTWYSDTKQLEEILRCQKTPREQPFELNGVRVSNRGQMHVQNLRLLKVKPEDLGRDPDGDKMRLELNKARKLVRLVLQDSCIEIAEDEREIECCFDSEQFIKYLNDKKQVTGDLKKKIENLFDDTAQLEIAANVVSQLVQFVKEVFKHVEEEKPSWNGMHGLQEGDLQDSSRVVKELLVQGKSQRLMSEISKILEKLCCVNKSRLCAAEGPTLSDFKRWGCRLNIENLLTALDPFFKEQRGFKIRKRIDVLSEMFRRIVDEQEQDHFIARDLSNIAEALICFVKFAPARLVQFDVRCHQEDMVAIEADGDVKGGKNGLVFIQTFRLNRKKAPACRIRVTATARVKMDNQEREFCLILAENTAKHPCHAKRELPNSCDDAKALQVVSRPAFREVVTLKLMYKHCQKKISCENNDFIIVQDQEEICKLDTAGARYSLSAGTEERQLAITCPTNQLDIVCSPQEVEVPSQETFLFLHNCLVSKGLYQGEEIQGRNMNERTLNQFLQWLREQPHEKLVNGMLEALNLNSRQSYLTTISGETKDKIRDLSQFIKSPEVDIAELFEVLRKRLPAGCTGPRLQQNLPIKSIPYEIREDLCICLSGYETEWKRLASLVGVKIEELRLMEKRNNPAEDVLIAWEKKGLTVNNLYSGLVECGCEAVADKL